VTSRSTAALVAHASAPVAMAAMGAIACAPNSASPLPATEIVIARAAGSSPRADSREPAIATSRGCPTGFAAVPSGDFVMGSEPGDGDTDEEPAHEETVHAFCMQRTETTSAEYEACVEAGRCRAAGTSEHCTFRDKTKRDHPINCVKWGDADAYCAWIGGRLPTEAEWEYAARGKDGRAYPWGRPAPSDRACWLRSAGTCAVGSIAAGASPFGLLDMAGNVWEWTSTPYCPYTRADCGSDRRVDRGGGWSTDDARRLRTSFRASGSMEDQGDFLGFRCARNGADR
jgi:formylglycine-generating enzyme required for sulfatase activity